MKIQHENEDRIQEKDFFILTWCISIFLKVQPHV